jgi:hypothetical protein
MLWIMVEAAQFDPADTGDDQITWTRSADGNYSAKSAYLMQFDGGVESSLPATVWHVWALIRCKVFLWFMRQNRVWTADRLLAWEWLNEYFCPLRCRNLETFEHLILECPFSRSVWTEVSLWASLPSFDPLHWTPSWGVADWFHKVAGAAGSAKYKGARSLAVLICWSLWKERKNFPISREDTIDCSQRLKMKQGYGTRLGPRAFHA